MQALCSKMLGDSDIDDDTGDEGEGMMVMMAIRVTTATVALTAIGSGDDHVDYGAC